MNLCIRTHLIDPKILNATSAPRTQNAGEVYYTLARKHDAEVAEDFLIRLPSLPIRFVLPGEDDIIESARLKSLFRLSYADAFAAALAIKEDAAIITGDPELREMVTSALRVEWIGPS